MDIASLVIFAGALMLAAGSPGPSIAALVARVISNGWRDVAPFLAAMWVGEILWLTAALTGLSALASVFHEAFLVLKYAGIVYLWWLAWQMWHAPVGGKGHVPQGQSGWKMFLAGLALTLGNPKIMVFYLALLPTLIDISAPSLGTWAAFSAVALPTLAVVDIAWIAAATRARRLLQTPRAMRAANRLSATAMGGAATVIATQ